MIFRHIDVVNCIVIFNARFLKTVFSKCLRLIASTVIQNWTTVLSIGCIKFFLTETIFLIYDPNLVQNLGKKGQILFSGHVANI